MPKLGRKPSSRRGEAGFDLGDLDDLGLRVDGLRARIVSGWVRSLAELRSSDGGADDFGISWIWVVFVLAV